MKTPLNVCIHKLQMEVNQQNKNTLPSFRHSHQIQQKNMKNRTQIKKKIRKHIIHIIVLQEEFLSSPHNTNQYLLTKHQSFQSTPESLGKEPGSLLEMLLHEELKDFNLMEPKTTQNTTHWPIITNQQQQTSLSYI